MTNVSNIYFAEKDWPDVWNAKSVGDKKILYPWLTARNGRIGCKYCKEAPMPNIEQRKGSYPSKEWRNCQVGFDHGDSRPKPLKLTMLRNKVSTHLHSIAHKTSAEIYQRRQSGSLTQELLSNQNLKYQNSTEKVFRLAYNIAKMDRPYTDFPQHIDCYKASGVDVGVLLHTNKSCASIIASISSDMRLLLVEDIIEHDSKISVLVDESTTISNQTGLVIHVRACLDGQPTTAFLDLVHLPSTDALSIVNAILATLKQYRLSDDYLRKHFICFASDGASVMTGSKSGVGARLKELFPQLVLWHCANHRLELAVGDAVEDVTKVNHFHSFMDSIYKLYSQSPKLTEELEASAREVSAELLKIGKVLDTRWSASSLRTVKAVWTSFHALAHHFFSKKGESSKFKGFYDTLTSEGFVSNLAVMFDALIEISRLSLSLQGRDISMVVAHRLIDQTVKALESLASSPGTKQMEAEAAVVAGEFKGQPFSGKNIPTINPKQFFRSLANAVRSRMMTVISRRGESASQAEDNSNKYQALLEEVSILDPSSWPLDYESIPLFGINLISGLCRRLRVLDVEDVCAEFKLLVARGGRQVNGGRLEALQKAVNCMPVSTADCERSFSVMNTVITKKRNRLEIESVSSLLFISILGPEITDFQPAPFVKNWLDRGCHSAADVNAEKRKKKASQGQYSHLNKIFTKNCKR